MISWCPVVSTHFYLITESNLNVYIDMWLDGDVQPVSVGENHLVLEHVM